MTPPATNDPPHPHAIDLARMAEKFSSHVHKLSDQHRVPGAAVTFGTGTEATGIYAGVERLGGPPVSQRSIFEIGSVTKVWTATLVLQLVSEGQLDLDTAVVDVVPAFRVSDPDLSRDVTIRHLLTHTGGFDGDLFHDTGEDDDALAAYVADLTRCTSIIAPLGTLFSYCNAGIVVLGRIIEILRSAPFDRVLRHHLVEPLGLDHVVTDPARWSDPERLVTGYTDPGVEPVPVAAMPRGMAPTGTRLSMAPIDLCRFGLAHAGSDDAGLGVRGGWLSAMRAEHVPVTVGIAAKWGDARGLGWGVHRLGETTMLAHNGHTAGQVTALRVFPDAEAAITVHASGGAAYAFIDQVLAEVVPALVGVRTPTPPAPAPAPVPIHTAPYLGRYTGQNAHLDIAENEDSELALSITAAPPSEAAPGDPVTLRQVARNEFVALVDDMGEHAAWVFVLGADGRASHISNGRTYPRES